MKHEDTVAQLENQISTGIANYEDEVAGEVSDAKKDEAKEKLRLLKKVDQMGESV